MNLGKENEEVEFKQSTSELVDAMKAISAMLNKQGHGVIYFGVKNNGDVIGQQVGENTERDISRMIYESIEPRIYPRIESYDFDTKKYFKVSFEGNNKPYSAKGIYYIRVSDENRILSQQELFSMIRRKTYSDDWEEQITNYTSEDIDEESLKNFYNSARNCGRLDLEEYDKERLLSILNLIIDGRLNNAGYYLFGKNVNINLKLSVFATDEKLTFIDLQNITGNIYQLVNKAINYIHSNIHWAVEIGERTREEIPEIPVRAIREIVINSFAHSKYVAETEHEINIFPSKVVIYNPGSFPDNLTPLDFVNSNRSSIKRNKIILDVLFRSKDVEKSGSGFKRVYDLCDKANVKCYFSTSDYGFTFGFSRKNTIVPTQSITLKNDLSESEMLVFKAITQNVKITRTELASLLGKSERTIQRITNSLLSKGYLNRVGSNRFGYWEITNETKR